MFIPSVGLYAYVEVDMDIDVTLMLALAFELAPTLALQPTLKFTLTLTTTYTLTLMSALPLSLALSLALLTSAPSTMVLTAFIVERLPQAISLVYHVSGIFLAIWYCGYTIIDPDVEFVRTPDLHASRQRLVCQPAVVIVQLYLVYRGTLVQLVFVLLFCLFCNIFCFNWFVSVVF